MRFRTYTPHPPPAGADADGAESGRLTRAAGAVAAATLCSRILGYVRDAVIAAYFGAGFEADAFLSAYRLPNLFRRLLGEGTLSSAFVPVLAAAACRQGEAAVREMAASAARFLAFAGAAACAAGIAAAPWFVPLLAPGFSAAKLDLTVQLTRIMLPYLLFAGLVSLAAAVLNVTGCFGPPALAPALMNAAMIAALAAAAPWAEQPAAALACGVLLGGAVQLLFQAPFLARRRMPLWGRAPFFHAALGRVARLSVPAVLGGAVHQINILAATLLASFLMEGSVSFLYYADRVVEFPLGVVAAAGATAVLPGMARAAAAGDRAALGETFAHAVRLVSFITLPAAAGLIILADPIVRLLFLRGEFAESSVRLTAGALSYYAVGLWAFALVRIVVAAFFALQDVRAPVAAAAASIAANLLLGAALMRVMAHEGLALATSLAAVINLALLVPGVKRRLPGFAWGALAGFLGRSLAATLIMSLVVAGAATALLVGSEGQGSLALALRLGAAAASGIAAYAAAAAALRIGELHRLAAPLTRRLFRR